MTSYTEIEAQLRVDAKVSGFGVKVLPSGKRNYILKYRTRGGASGVSGGGLDWEATGLSRPIRLGHWLMWRTVDILKLSGKR